VEPVEDGGPADPRAGPSREDDEGLLFEALDYLYTPSMDVAADARYFVEVLGGRPVFAVEAMGTRVAMIALTEGSPRILLTDHLVGDRPILIYRVGDLGRAMAVLGRRGWTAGPTLEIPSGPCCSFQTPGGHRIAIYERTRPEVEAHFADRDDF